MCAEAVQLWIRSDFKSISFPATLVKDGLYDQAFSSLYIPAFCHKLQPEWTVNLTEAKAQDWIQSLKGLGTKCNAFSDTRHMTYLLNSLLQTDRKA